MAGTLSGRAWLGLEWLAMAALRAVQRARRRAGIVDVRRALGVALLGRPLAGVAEGDPARRALNAGGTGIREPHRHRARRTPVMEADNGRGAVRGPRAGVARAARFGVHGGEAWWSGRHRVERPDQA